MAVNGNYNVSGDRLDRIETILERLTEKLDELVKLEARHDNTVYRVQRCEDRVDKMEEKMEGIQDQVRTNSMITGATERLGWIVVTAVVGVVAWFFK